MKLIDALKRLLSYVFIVLHSNVVRRCNFAPDTTKPKAMRRMMGFLTCVKVCGKKWKLASKFRLNNKFPPLPSFYFALLGGKHSLFPLRRFQLFGRIYKKITKTNLQPFSHRKVNESWRAELFRVLNPLQSYKNIYSQPRRHQRTFQRSATPFSASIRHQ